MTSDLLNFAKDGDTAQYSELLRYKAFVENESMVMTYKLCEGYRYAWSMGQANTYGHPSFGLEQISKAWLKIMAEGAATPYDEHFGKKADLIKYADIPSNSKIFWANSAYALFLINSDGFLRATSHCLNTVDNKDFNWFAKQILFVGDAANFSVKVTGLLLGGELLDAVLVKFAPSIFQLGGTLKSFADRYVTKSILNYMYLGLGLPVADSLMLDTQNKFKAQADFKAAMNNSEDDERSERYDQLFELRDQLRAALLEKKSQSGTKAQAAFLSALKKTMANSQAELFRKDYELLKTKDPNGMYTEALKFMLYFYDHPDTLRG